MEKNSDNNDELGGNLGQLGLSDLHKWVSAEALKIDNIEKYDLKIYGTEDKSENYASDIAFVDISAKNFNGEKKQYNLVIKYGNQNIKENLPIRIAFEREIDIYDKIVPLFHMFQEAKGLPLFASIPKCYLTKFTEKEEVVVLENLKSRGYRLHDRKATMDIDHVKLVLKTYAEWHAIGFALKHHNNEDYLETINSWTNNVLRTYFLSEHEKVLDVSQEYLFEVLSESGEYEIIEKYKEKMCNKTATDVMVELLDIKECQSVVLHSDNWNNNFLFKYEDNNSTKPRCTNVALLDFQLSYVGSPIFDISNFIYCVGNDELFQHHEELLSFYYNHLANYLKSFDCDPEKVFSFSDFNRHLEKYWISGAIQMPMLTLFALVDKDDGLSFEGSLDPFKVVVQTEEYKNRVTAVARHFVSHSFGSK